MTDSSDPRYRSDAASCLRCRRRDSVVKVSAVYDEASSEITLRGWTTGPDGLRAPVNLQGTTRSKLAQTLAPPRAPRPPHALALVFGLAA